jgi:hypothetical protein
MEEKAEVTNLIKMPQALSSKICVKAIERGVRENPLHILSQIEVDCWDVVFLGCCWIKIVPVMI